MAQVEQSNSGKKKKGAQKKMAIHVDFTPMVDMNMLLITFFMLCTTMIKSQTLPIILPTNSDQVTDQDRTQVDTEGAITLILDTEYDNDGKPVSDPKTGKVAHKIYYYFGKPDTTFVKDDFLAVEEFSGNVNKEPTGIRKILSARNATVLERYKVLKEQWRNKEITEEEFTQKAKENSNDSTIKERPTVLIKPGPNATYEALINAIDEMQINQISRYNIEHPNHQDSTLINEYKRRHPNS
jgi:biopolymer transport protein ExbD